MLFASSASTAVAKFETIRNRIFHRSACPAPYASTAAAPYGLPSQDTVRPGVICPFPGGSTANSPLISLRDLSIVATFTGGQRHIVRDLSFDIAAGERLAIVGESGSGKTMTAMMLLGLLPDNCKPTGDVIYGDQNIATLKEPQFRQLRGQDFVLMPQSGADFLNPSFKVRYQLYESLKKRGLRGAALHDRACELLSQAGFADPDAVLDKYPFQLSGGMAQRVVLAMGLAARPKLAIADEPTRGIDDETSRTFLDHLYTAFPGSAVIVITHNVSVASGCDNVLVLYRGELMEYGPSDKVLGNPSHPYTQSLIRALPENNFHIVQNDNGIDDTSCDSGCVFAARCPRATQKCKCERPPIVERGGVRRRCFQ